MKIEIKDTEVEAMVAEALKSRFGEEFAVAINVYDGEVYAEAVPKLDLEREGK